MNPLILISILLMACSSFLVYLATFQIRNSIKLEIIESNKQKLDREEVTRNTNRFLIGLKEFANEWTLEYHKTRQTMDIIDQQYIKKPKKRIKALKKLEETEGMIHNRYLQKYRDRYRSEGKRLKMELEILLNNYRQNDVTYGKYDRVYISLDLDEIINDLEKLILKVDAPTKKIVN